jgi:hypothetical protein
MRNVRIYTNLLTLLRFAQMMLTIGWKHKDGKVICMHAKKAYGGEEK